MRRHSDAALRGIKGLAGAAVDAARRSAPPRTWRFAVERLVGGYYFVSPVGFAWDACKEAVKEELENLQVAAGELVRTHNGLIPAGAVRSYMEQENYLPPGRDRTWEGFVVLTIEVAHPDPSAPSGPFAVVPAAMGRFTALGWETYDLSGTLLSKGEYPVPPAGHPNAMLKLMLGQCAFTFAQDGPEAWTGLWD
ncbi:MAG: hypothetical protein QOK43_2896 [Acidimicrobiaceae bacterium]|nr:hypothetical protein [Acidimicrobiaceae bacterium]